MSVRAETKMVTASSGHVQFWRDADGIDAARDEMLVGDMYDPDWPDVPLRLKPSPNVGD